MDAAISRHDQKLVMASSRRALGGRIFADVLGRCGVEASSIRRAPLRFKLIPNSLPQCPSSLPCAASLAHFSVARSSTEPYPPAPALCPAASNPSCLVSSQTRGLPCHNQTARPQRPRRVAFPHARALCARGGSSLHGTPPSNLGAPPPPLTRDLNSFGMLCCRCFELSPAATIALAALRSPPLPPSPCAPGSRSQKSNSGGPSNFPPHVHCPFNGSPNPSRSCRSRSNPPALARGTASGRTRGRHMAPTHTVCCPGPKGPGQERGGGRGVDGRVGSPPGALIR